MPDAVPLQAHQNEPPHLALGVSADPAEPGRRRIDSIDLLRGIVMVIMMLDHTRDFIHSAGFFFDPTDLAKTTTLLFLTRWITHFCAPVFVFLAGTGAYLQFARGKSKRDLSRFLVTRGLWLIVLELTLVRLGASFSFDYKFLGFLQVIWVIGVSMIVLAALIHLPLKVVGVFGLAMIALHNLLDRFQVQPWQGPGTPVPGVGAKLWMLLHQQGGYPIAGWPSPFLFVVYPLIPWIGVMAVGYVFGALYQMDTERRKRMLLGIGGTAVALFFVIRALDYYGDPFHWARQKTVIFTVLSFVNTTKYPPSLLYLLMTIGPAIMFLAWFEILGRGSISRFFITFGRVPLFFYLLQWVTAHLISVLLHWAFGKPVAWLFMSPVEMFANPPKGQGFSLFVVYLSWIGGVLLLYPLCKWFAGVKARRRDWWLSYL
jgi:uncharacterized membrane protein